MREMSLFEAERILGLAPPYTQEDAKAAYRKLVAANHPDAARGKGIPEDEATARTKAINEAYKIVKASSPSTARRESTSRPPETTQATKPQQAQRRPGDDAAARPQQQSYSRQETASARPQQQKDSPRRTPTSARPQQRQADPRRDPAAAAPGESHRQGAQASQPQSRDEMVQDRADELRRAARQVFDYMDAASQPGGQRPKSASQGSNPAGRKPGKGGAAQQPRQAEQRQRPQRSEEEVRRERREKIQNAPETPAPRPPAKEEKLRSPFMKKLVRVFTVIGKVLFKIVSTIFIWIAALVTALPWQVTVILVIAILACLGVFMPKG